MTLAIFNCFDVLLFFGVPGALLSDACGELVVSCAFLTTLNELLDREDLRILTGDESLEATFFPITIRRDRFFRPRLRLLSFFAEAFSAGVEFNDVVELISCVSIDLLSFGVIVANGELSTEISPCLERRDFNG